ncbi:piggyBac transposable element-derived protein 4-like [Latimeria chalumnae]|uniref:piggyBac transposable element-derived protein 4-like n=1 Tax=Latimeria chalumnae TaxID=7897 RepID=UPI0003C170DB|nr:PREDICTED: piggyBac transposable element-derived protein 4-like [Latimeria chalumnae]|eukprot:XP_005997448.1 PREDICTED: piggyBac transposable element-derived protein 4-like [Latimeria chalumnae]
MSFKNMSSCKWLSQQEILAELDRDSEVEEEVSETENNNDGDPDYHETSSDESEDTDPESAMVSPSTSRERGRKLNSPLQPLASNLDETFKSKDGNITWKASPCMNQGRLSNSNVIKMVPGPTRYAVTCIHDIASAFGLFIPPTIENIILQMTNLEGRRVLGEKWKELDHVDMQAYIGLLLLAGVYRCKGEATSSLWNAETGRAIFPATMSLETFHIITRVIRFDNRDTRADRRERDKLAAIREVWDKWVEILPLLYNPGSNVTVDECLVPFRGCCPFRQYMPTKPAKYGIKIWVTCDAQSSYAWNMQVYTGKLPREAPERNQGMHVVLEMTQGLRGHNVTCDNFFTSYTLGAELLKRKLTMLGTVRKSKPELPNEIVKIQHRSVHSSKFAFTESTAVVSYCSKKNKNVIVMSTMHKDTRVCTGNDKKPEMILDYNSSKGGVENLDKLIATYTCQRMTARWPVVIFYNIVDVSAYNAFVLWTDINTTWNAGKLYRRRIFLELLGKALVTPLIQRRSRMPRAPTAIALIQNVQTEGDSASLSVATGLCKKRARCNYCPSSNDNKTNVTCVKCRKYLCKRHMSTFCPTCAK